MRIIDRVSTFALLGAFSLVAIGTADAAEVTHFSADGGFASTNSFDGTASLDLQVLRNDTNTSAKTTNLFFNRQVCDANTCSGIFGFGTIPNGDFILGGGTAKLKTNLGSVAGYQCFSFFRDFVTSVSTQSPIACGSIDLDWKVIPRQSSSFSGTSTFVSGAFSNKQTGSQTASQAKVNGTLFGTSTAVDGGGIIGNNKSSVVIINRN